MWQNSLSPNGKKLFPKGGLVPMLYVFRHPELSFEKYCSVSKTVEPTATIHYKVILNGVELAK